MARYVDERTLRDQSHTAIATVSFRGVIRSARVGANDWIKLRFAPDEDVDALRRAAASLGMPKAKAKKWSPSGFASLFHDPFPHQPPLRYSTSILLPKSVYGAWEEALTTEKRILDVREYDMRSAYAWGGLRPIPIASSAWRVSRLMANKPGLYLANVLKFGSVRIPPHIKLATRAKRPVWLTNEEIEELDLTVGTLCGVVFSKTWEPRRRIDRIMETVPRAIWKRVFRSYWGIWASTEPCVNRIVATGKTWMLPNNRFDSVSAHWICSRVRNKIAASAKRAVHIYTDAIITPDTLPLGEQLGDWQEKAKFGDLMVRGAGRWIGREQDGKMIEKHSGTKTQEKIG